MTKTPSLLFAALGVAMLAAPAAPAHPLMARPLFDDGPPLVSARVDDLNLHGRAGAEVALRRFRNAASRACGPQPSDIRELGYAHDHRYCVQRNMEALVRAIDAPTVTTLFEQRREPHLASAL